MASTPQKNYRAIAHTLQAMENCKQAGNKHWYEQHNERLERIMVRAPSGGGIDSCTKLNLEKSTPNKLVFDTAYHHMDGNGSYGGWTEHTVIVKPSLLWGYDLTISGRNRNDIKDYLEQTFQWFLDQDERDGFAELRMSL
jgi:hypothetical protein